MVTGSSPVGSTKKVNSDIIKIQLSMENLLYYIFGCLTTGSIVLAVYHASQSKRLKVENENIRQQNQQQYERLQEVDNDSKYVDFMWKGWYTTDPKSTFEVTLNLKQIAKSENNPDLYKFEVLSYSSENETSRSNEMLRFYTDKFYQRSSGGWLNIKKNKDNLIWITQKEQCEIRDEKIKKLLNTSQ